MDYEEDLKSSMNGANVSYPTMEQYKAAQKDAFAVPLTSHEPMITDCVDDEEDLDTSRDAFEYTKRDEFTSEIFKMELRGLPKFFPPGQLKKLLTDTMQLDVKKIKPCGPGKEHCYVTFSDETSVQKAIIMLDGYKWKGKTLSTSVATAAPDPLIKHVEKKEADEVFKSTSEEVDKLPIEERVAESVTPFAKMPYEEQLTKKQEMAHNVLKKIGREIAKLNPELDKFVRWHKLRRKGAVCEMDAIIPSPVVDGYRNKCEFTIGVNSDSDEATVGFRVSSYKEGSVSVGPIDSLKHINDTMKAVVESFTLFIRRSSHAPFDPVSHSGVWRQLTCRTTNNGDCLIAVALHPQKLDDTALALLKQDLVQYCEGDGSKDGVTALFCVVFGQRQSGVEEDYEHLWGKTSITETVMGKNFRISPQAFFQINTAAAEKLYEVVGTLAEIDGTNVVADVCCGTGTIGICLAEHAYKVFGLEIVEQAVEDAQHNAALNNLTNTEFLVGNCEYTLPSIFGSVNGLEIKAVLDPPRAGVPASVIATLRKNHEISTVVYMACDPNKTHQNFQSLARPVSNQVKGQFFIPIRAAAVDMFPHTDKFELVVLWERYDETKWRRIMEGNPRPRDEEYFKRIPKLPPQEDYAKEYAEKKKGKESAKPANPPSGRGRRSSRPYDRPSTGRDGRGSSTHSGRYGDAYEAEVEGDHSYGRYRNEHREKEYRSFEPPNARLGGRLGGGRFGGAAGAYEEEEKDFSYGRARVVPPARSGLLGHRPRESFDYAEDECDGYGSGAGLTGRVGGYGASAVAGGFGAVGGPVSRGRGGGFGSAGAAAALASQSTNLSTAGRSTFGGTDPYSAAMAGYLAGFKDAKKIAVTTLAQHGAIMDPFAAAAAAAEEEDYEEEYYPPALGAGRPTALSGYGGARGGAGRYGGAAGGYTADNNYNVATYNRGGGAYGTGRGGAGSFGAAGAAAGGLAGYRGSARGYSRAWE